MNTNRPFWIARALLIPVLAVGSITMLAGCSSDRKDACMQLQGTIALFGSEKSDTAIAVHVHGKKDKETLEKLAKYVEEQQVRLGKIKLPKGLSEKDRKELEHHLEVYGDLLKAYHERIQKVSQGRDTKKNLDEMEDIVKVEEGGIMKYCDLSMSDRAKAYKKATEAEGN